MIKKVSMLSLIVLLLSFSATNVFAFPNDACIDDEHPHDAATVHWEANGGPPWGDAAHNHRDAEYFDNAPVYDAYMVWDCRVLTVDTDGAFDAGHGFINEFPQLGGGDAHKPRYQFHAGDTWPAEAQAAIRNAFSEWSAIFSDKVGHVVGLEFREDSPAEIVIHWHNDGDDIDDGEFGCVYYDRRPVDVVFEREPGEPGVDGGELQWWYGAKAATPLGRYHFYTVALHEIGHVVGLDDIGAYEGDVMYGSAGTRFDPGPDGPCFDSITANATHGARDLYMIELTREQAAALKAATTAAAPAVAPVNTPATITITNTGPVPIEVYGWEVTRPDGVVDAVIFAPRVVLPGATVVVTVYRGCADPGVYRYRVFWDPVSEGTFERYSLPVGGIIISMDKPALLAPWMPWIFLGVAVMVAAVSVAVYRKKYRGF